MRGADYEYLRGNRLHFRFETEHFEILKSRRNFGNKASQDERLLEFTLLFFCAAFRSFIYTLVFCKPFYVHIYTLRVSQLISLIYDCWVLFPFHLFAASINYYYNRGVTETCYHSDIL